MVVENCYGIVIVGEGVGSSYRRKRVCMYDSMSATDISGYRLFATSIVGINIAPRGAVEISPCK